MRGLVWIAALGLLSLFLGLDRVDFTDDREARDAVVAREILARREPLMPRVGGEPWLEKPVLGYAVEAAGARLTFESPVGSRALRAFGAILLTLIVAAIGIRHLGRRVGACSAAVLATSLALPLAVRSDGNQVFATALTWLGLGLMLDVLQGGRAAWRLPVAYVALAIVLLIAGPVPALWPLGAIALALGGSRGWSWWTRLHPLPGIAVLIGLGVPWYGAMIDRGGIDFVARSMAFPYAVPATQPWFVAPARALGFLFVGFFPWSPFLAASVLRVSGRGPLSSIRDAGQPPEVEKVLLAALVVAMVPMMLAPGAPLTSALPALPAAALLAGALVERALAGEPLWQRALGQGAWVLALTGTIAAVFISTLAPRLVEGGAEVRLLAAVLLVLSWAPLLASFAGRARALPALLALPVALGTALVCGRTLPALADYVSTRSVAQSMEATAPAGSVLLLLDSAPASLRLRVTGPLVEADDLATDLRRLRAIDGYAYVAYRPSRQSELARAVSPQPLEILARTPALGLARIHVD